MVATPRDAECRALLYDGGVLLGTKRVSYRGGIHWQVRQSGADRYVQDVGRSVHDEAWHRESREARWIFFLSEFGRHVPHGASSP